MPKYRVLVIAISLKNNLIGKSNEVVDESQLTSNPTELVEAGFIELVNEVENIEVVDEKVVEVKEVVEIKKPTAKNTK